MRLSLIVCFLFLASVFPATAAPPLPTLDDQVTAANLYWNARRLKLSMTSTDVTGFFSPQTTSEELTLSLKITGITAPYTTTVTTATTAQTPFTFTIPIADFNAAAGNNSFLGPQLLTVTDSSSATSQMYYYLSFYFPSLQFEREVQSSGNYILVSDSRLNTNSNPTHLDFGTKSLQSFSEEACAQLPTCLDLDSMDCNTNGSTITLTDARDGKSYQVRRFADGKCWMIDNLRYGGDQTDGCAGKSAFNGGATSTTSGSETGVSVYGTWTNGTTTSTNSLYGDCRDASAGAASTSPCYGNTSCGYYYSWQALMQQASLYYASGTSSGTPGLNGAGLCPADWQPPTSGSTTADFGVLDIAMGGTGNNRSGDATVLQNLSFYTTGGKFNSFYSGNCRNSGGLYYQGSSGYFWSQTGYSSLYAHYLYYGSSLINPSNGNGKYDGFAVRCLQTAASTYPTTFQTFTAADCNRMPICANNNTTADCNTNGSTITLTDERDGKQYQIRRFADGKCWMIDSLRYGGDTTDGCAGKSAFNGGATSTTSGSETGVSVGPGAWTNGTVTSGNSNLYGDCRDASAGAASTSPCYGNKDCGYYYSWQAVMQQASLYYASGTSGGTPLDNHGICPTGWHPPTSGSATAEFGALDKAMGGTGNNRSGDATVLQNLSFYTTGGKFNSFYSGYCNNSGGLYSQGSYGYFWSQTGNSSLIAHNLGYYSSLIFPSGGGGKYHGFAVRCVADE